MNSDACGLRQPSRREMILGSGGLAIAGMLQTSTPAFAGPASAPARNAWRPTLSLNTSTIRGQKLPLGEIITVAAKAGFGGIEPWADELDRHVESGGSLADARKRLMDSGLRVTGGIAFFEWMIDDDAARGRGLEQAKRLLERFSQIGATHMAAPPAGNVRDVNLLAGAERYRALLAIGREFGVVPALEIWGFAANVSRLGQAAMVAIEADHPDACVLPDVYHLYRGGSGFNGIRSLHGRMYAGFHLNDIPANPPPRDKLKDADRIYPGDGITPLRQVLRDLRDVGYTGPLSVELFNPEYYKQDALVVARTALQKTKSLFEAAMAE